MGGVLSNVILSTAGFVVPCYQTFKSLELNNARESEAVRNAWLVYWIVFAFLYVVEAFTGWLFEAVVPGYFFLKLGVVVWMQQPWAAGHRNGAEYIYQNMFRPKLLEHQASIDTHLDNLGDSTRIAAASVMKKGVEAAPQVVEVVRSSIVTAAGERQGASRAPPGSVEK